MEASKVNTFSVGSRKWEVGSVFDSNVESALHYSPKIIG